MEKILVPVDGSEQAQLAAKWAAHRAAESGGQVTLLHVHVLPSAETMAMAHMSREQIARIEEREAAPSFEKARAVMEVEPTETITMIGDPRQEIVALAERGGYDHIVMGSRGLSPLRELLLGSVSEHVIRKSHCPVTLLR
jgi:nucleotide-binding universal stress UspA family protein